MAELHSFDDVNNDGSVTAADALRIINELARRIYSDRDTSSLYDPLTVTEWPGAYFDRNGDGIATALDALRVINQLARMIGRLEGEQQLISSAVVESTFAVNRDPEPARRDEASVLLKQALLDDLSIDEKFAPARVATPSLSDQADKHASLQAVDDLLADDSFFDRLADDFADGR